MKIVEILFFFSFLNVYKFKGYLNIFNVYN